MRPCLAVHASARVWHRSQRESVLHRMHPCMNHGHAAVGKDALHCMRDPHGVCSAHEKKKKARWLWEKMEQLVVGAFLFELLQVQALGTDCVPSTCDLLAARTLHTSTSASVISECITSTTRGINRATRLPRLSTFALFRLRVRNNESKVGRFELKNWKTNKLTAVSTFKDFCSVQGWAGFPIRTALQPSK